ncbi:MAG: LacI family DNA-binding transcriptional regulator [Hyphomicrobiales bacterium]
MKATLSSKSRTSSKNSVRLIDVAMLAHVSQGTASNVFNKPEQVSEETRTRVFLAAEQLGYKGPDPVGRLLRAGKTNTIGVLISNPLSHFFTDPIARSFMSGIASVCDERGIGITLVTARDETKAAQTIRSALVDGFVVHCLEDDAHLVALAQNRNLPLAVVDAQVVSGVSHITIDDEAGARLAMEHALSLGHRRIGILTLNLKGDGTRGVPSPDRLQNISYAVSRKRMTGYAAALRHADIPVEHDLIFECGNSRETGAKGAQYLLSLANPPTAIVTMSDLIATGVIDHARTQKVDIPSDLSVVGYDDMPDAAFSDPPLTTINQPSVEKGRLAALAVLDGKDAARSIVLPVELIVRESTASPLNT